MDALQAEISQAQSQAQTPPADTSPELEAANRDVQAAQDAIAAAQMRVDLAQKALDALD